MSVIWIEQVENLPLNKQYYIYIEEKHLIMYLSAMGCSLILIYLFQW